MPQEGTRTVFSKPQGLECFSNRLPQLKAYISFSRAQHFTFPVEELSYRQLTQQSRLLAAHADQRDDLDDEWRTAVSLNDWSIRLSPAMARKLADELNEGPRPSPPRGPNRSRRSILLRTPGGRAQVI